MAGRAAPQSEPTAPPNAAPGQGQRTIAFSTLGCKLNQYESDSLATRFRTAGYEVVDPGSSPQIHVINSCTVTTRADRKSRNLLNRSRNSTTDRLTVLTGCFVENRRDQLESAESLIIVPNDAKQSIYEIVEAHLAGELFEPHGSVFDFPVPDRSTHTRTMIKIQDGCDNRCTFCIIPMVRGRAQSRPAGDVIEDLGRAIAGGAKEIVLTGVNMSRYRDDRVRFTDLVARCLDLPGDYRIRISSLEPDRLPTDFARLFLHPKLCPHLHLCLQSASEPVLLAMRRQYTYSEYREIAARLREVDPLFNLTTDLIVGFPGESDVDFAQNLDAIAEHGFGHVHVFPYSARSGTRAAQMPGHLPDGVKTERSRTVREVSREMKRRYRSLLVGTTEQVLVERVDPAPDRAVRLSGLGRHYIPISVQLPTDTGDSTELINTYVDVRLTALLEDDDSRLIGVPL